MVKKNNGGLGKGLGAIFQNHQVNLQPGEEIKQIAIKDLKANPYQPRQHFDEEALQELAQSIAVHGILQPIVAREGLKSYDIVAGERRFRAAQLAGLTEVPVIVRPFTDTQLMELAIIENLQRENLNPLEEANSYQVLMDKLSFTQEDIAKRLGKSRSYVANMLRLLALPSEIKKLVNEGLLTYGHARTLLSLKAHQLMIKVAHKVIDEHMSVRALEVYVKQLLTPEEVQPKPVNKSIFIVEQEKKLRQRLGTSVAIHQGQKKGKIEITFLNDEDLNRILDLLKK